MAVCRFDAGNEVEGRSGIIFSCKIILAVDGNKHKGLWLCRNKAEKHHAAATSSSSGGRQQ